MLFLFYFTYSLDLLNICENLRSSADNKKRCGDTFGSRQNGHAVTAEQLHRPPG